MYGLTPALALVGNDGFTSGKASQNGRSDSLRRYSVTAGADYSFSKRTDGLSSVYPAGTYQHATGIDQRPCGACYFSALISFARIRRARSTLRLMPSSFAAWI